MKKLTKMGIWASLFGLSIMVYGCASRPSAPDQITLGEITGRVYFDQNADKDCEECECGIEDVRINLFEGTCSGTAGQSILTDADGYFTFISLPAGDYCIFADLAPTCDGYQPTTSISQQVVLGPGESLELDGFGFDTYVDSNQ
jgi:hypothetical protein